MTSDYQSGASAMREMAAKAGRAIATENYRPLLGSEIEGVILALPLPADPVSSEGEDELEVQLASLPAELELSYSVRLKKCDAALAARDAEIATLRAALERIAPTAPKLTPTQQCALDWLPKDGSWRKLAPDEKRVGLTGLRRLGFVHMWAGKGYRITALGIAALDEIAALKQAAPRPSGNLTP